MPADRLRWLAAITAAALLTVTSAAVASIPDRPAPAVAPTPDMVIALAAARARAGDCRSALGLLDPLVLAAAPGDAARFAAQLLRMPCLASVGRGAEVAPVLSELERQAPTHPLVQGYRVLVDVDAGRYAAAADGLAKLSALRSPALPLIPGQLWRVVAQKLTIDHDYARRDRTSLALALADWAPADQPDIAEALAADGVGSSLDKKDVDTARMLLNKVRQPGALWGMAIEHRFAPLWPEIEARLGPESGTAADRYARATLATYTGNQSGDRVVRDTVRAFLTLGRLDDAVATAAPIAVTPEMSEERVQTVLGAAEALSASGDAEGAAARLRPFATLDLARTPEAAMALISLSELLHEAQRYDEELSVARSGLGAKAAYFSPFGVAWLRRSETCALVALHRDAEAKASGDALKAATADNDAAAIEGLLCAGRDREAAVIAVAALATTEGADRLADQFQPSGAIYAHPPSRLRASWARLLARADVRAAFDSSARILPKPLWPASAPRAVPVVSHGIPTT